MLIHTYFTDGFYRFGEIFIESFKKIYGEEMPIIATTRNLTDKQMIVLDRIYKNLIIMNEKIDMVSLSKRSGYTIEQLLKFKNDVEDYKISPGNSNIIWKQYISVEDRYRNSLLQAFDYNHGEKYMMHIDSDSYVRKNLDKLFNVIKNNDVSLIFKLERPKDIRKIFGTLSGYSINDKSRKFLLKWREYIDKIHLRNKPQGYGQASCYYAYRDLKESDIKWGKINREWVDSNLKDNLLIWSGNHGRGKNKTYEIFKKDFKGK